MITARTASELRVHLHELRREGRRIGLVPTMGALHSGHRSMIKQAAAENEATVVSIFVNPIQFGEGEDFGAYPRDLDNDSDAAMASGATHLFTPSLEEMYPTGFSTEVSVSGVTEVLCGDPERRGPAHFAGVTTIVTKLLNIVQPDVAYFGQKDAQQVAVVRKMVQDLNVPVAVKSLPTIRDPDGLATSSRNRYLSAEEREQALAIPRALEAARDCALAGRTVTDALAEAATILGAAGLAPEYLEARDPDTMESADDFDRGPVLVALAVKIGRARLIDNVLVEKQPIAQEVISR